MVINIFGVGRSGTKAIQYYLSYLLAEKYGQVRINYEPYFWRDRKVKSISYKGLLIDYNDPQVCDEHHDCGRHKSYLESLIRTDSVPVVNKFIRGNGRIGFINHVTRPDMSIVVIRKLPEVLDSLSNMRWNFYDAGFMYFKMNYYDKWHQLILDLEKSSISLSHIPYAKSLKRRHEVHRNALYWYYMNLLAINEHGGSVRYLDYEKLSEIEKYIQLQDDSLLIEGLGLADFGGEGIHTNDRLIERYFYKDNFRKWDKKIFLNDLPSRLLSNPKIGSICGVSDRNGDLTNTNEIRPLRKITYDSFIQELNDEVMEKLQKLSTE